MPELTDLDGGRCYVIRNWDDQAREELGLEVSDA